MSARKNTLSISLLTIIMAIPALAGPAPMPPKKVFGVTMRIRQTMIMEKSKVETDYQARFLDERQFRVEGKMNLIEPNKEEHAFIAVGNGAFVWQYEQTPAGQEGMGVDMERVRQKFPDYEPARTYDPGVYRALLADGRSTKIGEEEMDGVAVTKYEANLPEGRLSLPANVPNGLPDPAKVRFWYSFGDGIVRRVEMDDGKGATFLTVIFSDIHMAVRMAPDEFVLNFPKGVTPKDQTEAVISLLTLTRIPPASAEGKEKQEEKDKPPPAKPAEKAAP